MDGRFYLRRRPPHPGTRLVTIGRAQGLFYHHCRPAIDKIYPGTSYTRPEIDKLAEHVTQFSLAALREIATGKKK